MELRKGYKQSDIGIIPDEWDDYKIGEVCKIKRGKFTPRPRNNPIYYGGNIPFVQTGDVTRSNGKISSFSQTLNKKGIDVSTLFAKGTILMTIAANIGYTGILQMDMACPDSLVSIDGNEIIDNVFLNYYLTFKREDIEQLSTVGAQRNLNIERLSPFKIPIPKNKQEQIAIANILSDTDSYITSLEKLIEKKRKIKQGAMQELLKPKDGWELTSLGNIVKINKGQLITDSTRNDGDIPVIAGGKKPAYFHNKFNRSKNTITISGSGANAGFVSFHDYPIFASDCSTIEENNKISIHFIYYFLQSNQEKIYKMQTGGAQPHIHPTDLKPMQIAIPNKEIQLEIANILIDLDEELSLLEFKLEKAIKIKQGMMQNLLTGKIRLL